MAEKNNIYGSSNIIGDFQIMDSSESAIITLRNREYFCVHSYKPQATKLLEKIRGTPNKPWAITHKR